MEVFFIRYRKMLLFGSIFMFLYFFYEIYRVIESIGSSKISESVGALVDASISLFVSVYFFINVRKANATVREQNAAETNSDNYPES